MKVKKKVFKRKKLGSKDQFLSEFQKVEYREAGPGEDGEDVDDVFSQTAEEMIMEVEAQARTRLKALGLPTTILAVTYTEDGKEQPALAPQLKDPDAPGHWEAKTLFHAYFLREYLNTHNTELAVRQAMRLVHVAWQGRWIGQEENMLRGGTSKPSGKKGGEKHAPRREEHPEWVRIARRVLEQNSEMGLFDVAEEVCQRIMNTRPESYDAPDPRTVWAHLKEHLS